MNLEQVTSFASFIEHTENLIFSSDLIIFRGQPIPGNLLPNVARSDPKNDSTVMEEKQLDQLSLQGASFLASGDANQWDLLIRAQHFGLKTRLLDWSSNPLVALWFACSSNVRADSFVYALEADSLLVDNLYQKSPFQQSETRVIQPKMNNARIIAQHGWFTAHKYSAKWKKFVPLERNPKISKYLTEYRIPEKRKQDILISLDRHGINNKTLFPDLEGLCKHLNWKFES